ncbi:MAG: DUF6242 domain-containing protein [Fermentimonas sp.]
MRFTYFLWLLVATLNLLLWTSCLGSSNDRVIDYSPNAQIYAFSLTSRADTANLLNATSFSIDQVNGKIFNKEPLPYLFHVDSAILSVSSSSTYASFQQITITLTGAHGDSTYLWNRTDSVAINRLKMITTIAQDGVHTKSYTFQLNIYQQDPYILSWERKADYLPSCPIEQKSIAFNGRFITYYKTGSAVGATTTVDGSAWSNLDELQGLPTSVRLSTLIAVKGTIYILDEEGRVHASTDGISWNKINTGYTVKNPYGILPGVTVGRILIAVKDDNMLRFAVTDDFSEIELLNQVPDKMPWSKFTSTSIESDRSYATKYIVLTDGIRQDGSWNDEVWIVQKKDDEITYISKKPSFPVKGSNLFYYDDRLYLMTLSDGKNIFLFSGNYGLDWEAAAKNQAFPAELEFTPRTNASVTIDDSNNIWIFGGISAHSPHPTLVDVWRGKLNKFSME